jgi:hypothetical protein
MYVGVYQYCHLHGSSMSPRAYFAKSAAENRSEEANEEANEEVK